MAPRKNIRLISQLILRGLALAPISFASGLFAATPEPQRILDAGMSPSDTTLWSTEQRVDQSDSKWASHVCGDHPTFAIPGARYEWTPVYSGSKEYGSNEPVSGWVLWQHVSDTDVPFTHPFGKTDFTYLLRPDPGYVSLLATENLQGSATSTKDQERVAADAWGASNGVPSGGLLEIEQDQGLIPAEYRPKEGDRVAVFGRWIVDCGHDSWLTEIHPPLLTAVGRTSVTDQGANVTHVSLISNPYLVSQEFPNGGIVDQLSHDVAEVNFSPPLLPITWHVSAEANFLPPTSGLQMALVKIRAPTAAPSPSYRLYVRMHLTARPGVVAQPFMIDSETLAVLVLFTDDLTSLPISGWHYWDVSAGELKNLNHDAGVVYQGIISEAALIQFDPVKLAVLAQGIRGLQYDSPADPDLSSATIIKGWADQSPWGQSPFTVDATQAFPLIGWIEVSWGNPTAKFTTVVRRPDWAKILATRINDLRGLNARKSTVETRMAAIGALISATVPTTGIDGAWRYTVLTGPNNVSETGQMWLKANGTKLRGIIETQGKKAVLDGEVSPDATKVILNRHDNAKARIQLVRSGDAYKGTIIGSKSRIELARE